ncbi:UBX domain-containing protein 1 [Sporothrix schenckii 1099-18]|uniref:UBX domain-containing protein n=2 Tax=Sporothrix schenckii TaxID=29908 RepID=U7PXW3_SPOS1|nr:UBX domain-containing protein 1 [Sporothrix schenckii 1099-18]ERT00474.1 hypothetical protein HMPREF1624_03847 [Sporothrix schenckii ATCC 58251]KJR85031.1 UBX domain-containing protein 1 [Sporothrix schenckii 1099-18]
MAEGLSKDEIISSFCGITGVSSSEATDFLDAADWDADAALAEFYQSQEDATSGAAAASGAAAPAAGAAAATDASYTGPRTLDGRPAPQSYSNSGSSSRAASTSSRQPQPKRKGLMTMSSLQNSSGSGSGHGHGHAHDDDDDNYDSDDEDDKRGRGDLFAGGEKSGLAVQDPTVGGPSSDARRVMRDIVAKAKAQAGETPGPSQPPPSRFRGSGQTLGGEGAESRTIPDPAAAASGRPSAAAAADAPAEQRVLHIWQDGFSVDDGPLHRYDDPQNAADLQMIRQGRAPLHLMNVPFAQAVDIKLHEHEENWHQLPRVYRPFAGEGHRLGSPVPGAPTTAAAAGSIDAVASGPASSSAPAATTSNPNPTTHVDENLPTVNLRVQLPDGTRLPARFNTTQTISDVYDFVQRALPASSTQGRAWVLATTFPNKEHTDKSLVLGETDEFKRGGAAVVKWV